MTSLHACLGCSRLAKTRRAVVAMPVANAASSILASSRRTSQKGRVSPQACRPCCACIAPSDGRVFARTQPKAVPRCSRRSCAFFARMGRLLGCCDRIFGARRRVAAAISTLSRAMRQTNGGTCGAPTCVVAGRAPSARAVSITAATVLHRVAAIAVFLSMCSMPTKQML